MVLKLLLVVVMKENPLNYNSWLQLAELIYPNSFKWFQYLTFLKFNEIKAVSLMLKLNSTYYKIDPQTLTVTKEETIISKSILPKTE